MATRVKLEVVYTLPDDDVQQEANRLVHYMRDFVPASCGSNAAKPHYDTLGVYAETMEWERVANDHTEGR